VAEAEHAVAARIVQHRALEGDDPRPARGQRDVGIDRIGRIEVDETRLHRGALRVLVHREDLGELAAHRLELGARRVDRLDQLGIVGCQAHELLVGQAAGADGTGLGAQVGKGLDRVHGASSRQDRMRKRMARRASRFSFPFHISQLRNCITASGPA
jgi:hypothetical protein